MLFSGSGCCYEREKGDNMSKRKLGEIEILRGIGFLAVVLQHVIAGVFYLPGIDLQSITVVTLLLGLSRFAVPLFVFITGLVLFYNYDRQMNYYTFIKKRFVQVIIPYILATLLYYVWVSLLGKTSPLNLSHEAIKLGQLILTGKASYHLWFMVMIIPFYVLFPLFRFILSKERKFITNLVTVVVFFMISFLLVYALRNGLLSVHNAFLDTISPYYDRNFLFWSFYFVVGGFAGIYYDQSKSVLKRLHWPNLGLLLILTGLVYKDIVQINAAQGTNNFQLSAYVTLPLKPFMMLMIISLLIGIFQIAEGLARKENMIVRTLKTCGAYSFEAYLIHAFVLRFTNRFVLSFVGSINIFVLALVSLLLCVVFTLIICYIVRNVKTTASSVVIGKAQ